MTTVNPVRNGIQIINPTEFEGWDDLVLRHPDSSFYHSSAWARVLAESYAYTPVYFTVLDGDRLASMLPVMEVKSCLTGTRGVSLPFTDYCDPITNQGTSFKDLLCRVIDFGKNRKWRYIELRGGSKLLPQALSPINYSGHILDLSENTEELFYGFKDSTRRNIRKANREGVEVRIFNTLVAVKEFYRLNCLTRRMHGLPPQPYGFFKNIHQHVIAKDHGFVALASYLGRFIAGAVFFHMGKKALYKYGASDQRYQQVRANNLVMSEAIKWYSQNGYRSIHFGSSEPQNEGLVRFKSGWGTTEHTLSYYRYDLRKNAFVPNCSKISGLHNMIFRRMPLPLLNAVGKWLYRHAG